MINCCSDGGGGGWWGRVEGEGRCGGGGKQYSSIGNVQRIPKC